MKMGKISSASVLALGLMLSACGGGSGGVASTPTPSPSPSPSPTPSPTPTPTPTPNVSLIGPLTSESFANHATTSRGNYDSNGVPPTNLAANPTTLTIAYDQGSQSYTVTTQSRSQTFAAADVDLTQSNAQITTYKKVNGTTTDLLTLTKPGTSGSLTYRYVAGGFWQRTVQTGTSIAGSFDSFAYGVVTPNASVPTTGGASYDIDFLGVLGIGNAPAPYSLRGTGSMTLDFGAGVYTASGTNAEIDTQSGLPIINDTFSSQGTLTASTNSLTGSFQLNRGGNGGQVFAGGTNGRFYGPAAEEIGAAVWGVSQSGASGALSGVLLGRKNTSGGGTNLSLLSLVANQNFVTKGARAPARPTLSRARRHPIRSRTCRSSLVPAVWDLRSAIRLSTATTPSLIPSLLPVRWARQA